MPLYARGQIPQERGITLTSTVSIQRDSNVLRLQDGERPSDVGIDGDSRADTIVAPVLQIDVLIGQRQQQWYATLLGRESRLDRYGRFDTSSLDYRGGWAWAVSDQWRGQLSGGRESQISALEDFLGSRRNVITVRTAHADVQWTPRPDRRLGLAADANDGRNSEAARQSNDYSLRTLRIDAAVVSPGSADVGVALRSTDGEYPNPTFIGFTLVGNSYRQYDADVVLRLRQQRRLKLDLRAGYAWRRYDEIPERDVEGPGGRLALTWQATAKIDIEASAERDFSAIEDLATLYTLSDRRRVAVRYLPSAQWGLTAEYRRRDVRYRGDPNDVLRPDETRRADVYLDRRIGLTWLPARRWIADLSYSVQSRGSNEVGRQYRAESVQCVVQYRVGPW